MTVRRVKSLHVEYRCDGKMWNPETDTRHGCESRLEVYLPEDLDIGAAFEYASKVFDSEGWTETKDPGLPVRALCPYGPEAVTRKVYQEAP